MQKITLDLEVKLKPKELEEKGQAMASAVLQYDEYDKEKKAIAKEIGDKLKDLHVELSALAKVTRRKTEVRPVECTVELDTPETGTKRITRTDTKAVIKEMPMTMAERQSNLFEDSEGAIESLNKLFSLPSEPSIPGQPEE